MNPRLQASSGSGGAVADVCGLVRIRPAVGVSTFLRATTAPNVLANVGTDLELVRNPSLVLGMSRAQIEKLRGSTRAIALLIVELPWTATNFGVLSAALLAFGVPDDLIAYVEWLSRYREVERAA